MADLSRRALLASASLLALSARAEAYFPRGSGAASGGGGGNIATVTVNNFGGSTQAAGTPVRFAHVFADSDVPSGSVITLTDGAGNNVPFTAARQSIGLNGQLICVDILAKTARSIASSGSDTFAIKALTGSFSNTLPGSKTIANVVTDITTNFSNITAKVSGLNYGGTCTGSVTATGYFQFTGVPLNGDTITIRGVTVTFVTGTPTGNQVQIGADATTTVNNAVTFLNGSADANLKMMTYSLANGPSLYMTTNANAAAGSTSTYTLAKSSSAISPSNPTLIGTTLVVASISQGAIGNGQTLSSGGVGGTTITIAGSVANMPSDGGIGSYALNTSQVIVAGTTIATSGGTLGSGNWAADLATGFAAGTTVASTGYYRCVATGPTAADFVVYAPLYDLVGHAQHPTIFAVFYVTAFLNPATGAVTHLCWRVWIKQGKDNVSSLSYRSQPSLSLNSTVVRGWGGNAGDGRTLTFSSSAISANAVSLPGNTFTPGQLVQFSTTGTLPTGLSPNIDYCVAPTTNNAGGASTIYVYASSGGVSFQNSQGSGAQQVASGVQAITWPTPTGYIALTNTGSGTHTIQGYTQLGFYSMSCLADTDGGWDWHVDNTGALGGKPTLYAVQDNAYYHKSKKLVPIDLTINLATSSGATQPSVWAPMGTAGIRTDVNTGGQHQEYGGAMNEYACRRFRYPSDRTGYCQVLRCGALAHANWSYYLHSHNNFRLINSTTNTYTGLDSIPNADLLSYSFTVPPIPGGSMGPVNTQEDSHLWTFVYTQYVFEGGQDMLDLVMGVANSMMQVVYYTPSGHEYASLTRNPNTSSGIFWSCIRPAGEPRDDAWTVNAVCDAWVCTPSQGIEATYPEKAMFAQILHDTASYLTFCRSTSGYGSVFASLGGWHTETTTNGPQNVSNVTNAGLPSSADNGTTTNFMQFYIATSWAMACARFTDSNFQVLATHMGNWVDNLWTDSCNIFSNVYTAYVKTEPGWASGLSNNDNFCSPSLIGLAPQAIDGVFFAEDGHTVYVLNDYLGGVSASSAIPLQNGDQVYFTDGSYDVTGLAGTYALPPTGMAYTWYYAQNVTSIPGGNQVLNSFTLSTDAAGLSPVTWTGSAVVSQSTISNGGAGITSVATSIPLAGTITTNYGSYSANLCKIGTEYINLTRQTSVSTLTASSGSGYPTLGALPARGAFASTAASHADGSTVTVYRTVWMMVHTQSRTVGCPANTTVFGDSGSVPFGYLTGYLQSAGILYMMGAISQTAYNNIVAIFNNQSGSTQGPGAFAIQNSLMLNVAASLTW